MINALLTMERRSGMIHDLFLPGIEWVRRASDQPFLWPVMVCGGAETFGGGHDNGNDMGKSYEIVYVGCQTGI